MKIAILGSHPQTKMLAPFADPEWQIWACSPHNFSHGQLPRVDEWFEVHVPAAHPTRSPEYLDFVRELTGKIPVWMRDRTSHPGALEYPEAEMKARFGPFFMTSSIALMMAKAIVAEPETIGLWGVVQATKTEYEQQRPAIQQLMWEAHKLGIGIDMPEPARRTILAIPREDW